MSLRRFIRSIEPSLRAQTLYMVSTSNTDDNDNNNDGYNNMNATQIC